MANHLIIGLGGTGGKVLREMRKRIYEEFRSNDPGNNVHIDYVYVDSSPTDLNDRAGWKVLGKSVHLGTAQKVNINGISTAVLQNINQFPGLKSFLNQNDINLMLQSMGPLITAGIGGQRRRLGRTLIANNMSDRDNPANFEQIIRTAVGRLQQDKSGDANVTFHICAGLAGGTGSGSIIDVISLIRTWYPFEPGKQDMKMANTRYASSCICLKRHWQQLNMTQASTKPMDTLPSKNLMLLARDITILSVSKGSKTFLRMKQNDC